ncbi:sodium-coupled monocarboxylate transporter 1-like [Haliotis asinina]|uniref:sodium-coupled monocarboxylate transporter 1-like n=1 Tax=Haliotis asinina TaxID=109174 RepID=UPI0035320C69
MTLPVTMESQEMVLGAADYVVFALVLFVSAGIGIVYAFSGNSQKTTGEFLMGGGHLKIVPVSISILVSFMSAVLILGSPAEMYREGTQYYLYTFGLIGAIVVSTVLYVPLLYPLKYTSSFEYLEKRFNSRAARLTGTSMMIVKQVTYMGVVSLAPSTALEAVTGFPTWATIITIGLVATFYTYLGGMKAVVWADVFQGVMMLVGVVAIIIRGSYAVGGLVEVWRINKEWDRIKFFDFNPDPAVRQSFWSLVIGTTITWSYTYGLSQVTVQRYCALPTLRQARLSVILNIVGVFVLMTSVCLAGIIMFAYYAQKGCDPLSDKKISNPNQLVPYFVMDVLGYPGLPGLFISSLFSGALSTMSSSLSALSAVCWEDFFKPALGDRLTEAQRTLITKLLVLFFGAAGIGVSFMTMHLGGTILQVCLSFTGAAAGPILGMFILGAFFPWANWIGAVVGGVLGLVFPFWISIGAYTIVGTPSHLEYPTHNCSVLNGNISMATTTSSIVTTAQVPVEYTGVSSLYTVSYLWYSAIGAVTVVVVGLLVSATTGMNRVGDVEPRFLLPLLFPRCLPEVEGPLCVNSIVIVTQEGPLCVNSIVIDTQEGPLCVNSIVIDTQEGPLCVNSIVIDTQEGPLCVNSVVIVTQEGPLCVNSIVIDTQEGPLCVNSIVIDTQEGPLCVNSVVIDTQEGPLCVNSIVIVTQEGPLCVNSIVIVTQEGPLCVNSIVIDTQEGPLCVNSIVIVTQEGPLCVNSIVIDTQEGPLCVNSIVIDTQEGPLCVNSIVIDTQEGPLCVNSIVIDTQEGPLCVNSVVIVTQEGPLCVNSVVIVTQEGPLCVNSVVIVKNCSHVAQCTLYLETCFILDDLYGRDFGSRSRFRAVDSSVTEDHFPSRIFKEMIGRRPVAVEKEENRLYRKRLFSSTKVPDGLTLEVRAVLAKVG